jgi:hypothetical protein
MGRGDAGGIDGDKGWRRRMKRMRFRDGDGYREMNFDVLVYALRA